MRTTLEQFPLQKLFENKNEKKLFFPKLFRIFGKFHCDEKTERDTLCLQNALVLLKIEWGNFA